MISRWDPRKASAKLRKYGVAFQEPATVMGDPLSTTFPDPAHSLSERRYLGIGMSTAGRLLVVAHTEEGDIVRIIRARRATPRERRFYEEGREEG